MPKSKRGKGKQPHYNKARPKQVMPAATAGTTAPAAPIAAAAVAAPSVRPAAAPRPNKAGATVLSEAQEQVYVTKDLKRIGILTGVIVIVLVILAFIIK